MRNIESLQATMRIAALLLIPFLAACTAKTPAIQMRFVDDVDGGPVADAKVLYCASAWQGTLTGHGGMASILFRIEATTDAGGELKVPPQEFASRPFGMSTNYGHSKLLIAKPGYEPYKIDNWGAALGEYAAVSTWAFNGATIRLKRSVAGTTETRRRGDPFAGTCGEGWFPRDSRR
jgi:hypothetical protein